MHRKGLLILALMVVGVIVLGNVARHVLVQQPLLSDTQIHFEHVYTLSGALSEDLVVFAETIDLPADSRVTGNVALLGDTVTVNGPISGDLTVLASQVHIGPDADISGNATLLAETAQIDGHIAGALHVRSDALEIHDSAQIEEMVYVCAESFDDTRLEPRSRICHDSDLWSSTQTLETLRDPNFVLPLLNITISGAALAIMATAVGSLALSGLSILAVVLFPRQISHIEEAVRTGSRSLGGTGIMLMVLAVGVTFAAGLAVVVVPMLGVVIVPLYLLAALLFFGMTLAGWITITLVVGDLILRRLNLAMLPPLVITAVGNVGLLLVWNLLALTDLTRLLGLLGLVALSSVGLGAACITRMGTKPVHRSYLVQG
jgi:cytoskeletal protein CcmA (bactofilin family)